MLLSHPGSFRRVSVLLLLPALLVATLALRGQALLPTSSAAGARFGSTSSTSGNIALVNAQMADVSPFTDSGELYLFRNLYGLTASNTAVARLHPSDFGSYFYDGSTLSVSGTQALVGGSTTAYLFRGLDTATGTINESATLTVPSASAAPADSPYAVALSGANGLVGAFPNNNWAGNVYLYRGLDTATGAVSSVATLAPSISLSQGGNPNETYPYGSLFGQSLGLSGNIAVVGAPYHSDSHGAAFLYRDLDTATGTVTQNAILTATSLGSGDLFGASVSVSGTSALVSAPFATVSGSTSAGRAYLYRNLDSASGTVTETATLVSSSPGSSQTFGGSVALSGDYALISTSNTTGAHFFTGLSTATGTVTERGQILSYGGTINSISLDGDRFVVGAVANGSFAGSAASGSLAAISTLDTGNSTHLVSGYNVQLNSGDWIVGATTSANQVTLGAVAAGGTLYNSAIQNSATQMTLASGGGLYIGRDAGANNNVVTLESGALLFADSVHIGAVAGNSGNTLRTTADTWWINAATTVDPTAIYLAPSNKLQFYGDYSDPGSFFNVFSGTHYSAVHSATLLGWNGSSWQTLNAGNYATFLALSYDGTYTTATAVPEPSTYAAFAGLAALALVLRRRSAKSAAAHLP